MTEDSSDSLFDPPDTIESLLGNDNHRLVFQALPESIDTAEMPVLGNPDAPHVLVEMMDYTCTHCRHLHPHLHAAVERYGDKLGIVIFHVPLSKKCNQYVAKDYAGKKYACDYAQLAIGVWKLDPKKFPEFHNWLLESEKPPSITQARKRARKLVGNDVILDKEMKVDTSRRLGSQSTSLKRLKSGLPVLLLQNGALRGVPEKSQKLFDYLESKLGIEAL